MTEAAEMEILLRIPLFRKKFEESERKGLEKGLEEGIEKMLRGLFAHQMGRPLSAEEQELLMKRTGTLGPEQVQEKGLELEGEALAAWLLDPAAR